MKMTAKNDTNTIFGFGRPIPEPEKWYSLSETLYMLGMSMPTLKKYVRLGKIKEHMNGERRIYYGSDLLDFFAVSQRNGRS